MRVVPRANPRGSLKWIQLAVNQRCNVFDALVLAQIPAASSITWQSPLATDEHAEYRDGMFLQKIGHSQLASALATYWPARGPQWDALGVTDRGEVLLVEAKAHIDEMFSSGMQARAEESRQLIERTLAATADSLNAKPLVPWTGSLYQTANRIAHLKFLGDQGIAARLIFVCFVGDIGMGGPETAGEWRGALHVTRLMLGLPKRHRLSDRLVEIFVPIQMLA